MNSTIQIIETPKPVSRREVINLLIKLIDLARKKDMVSLSVSYHIKDVGFTSEEV